ncbi:uncharacterized protein LOC110113971 isoform X1 [Dendrobium catenatum]|uniref:Uncharacterized protein n=1 Tax=Dendrobium catenatum TaxID=906689 RepID=A0A2I0VCQ0_9ASPA|nr:uncharacterized protein LOC110113971 isoform X1 [Dendrobium catenatum]PKU61186.1 hypothetical protein MA16_Dca022898 [Dendrobium catenatum]
MDGFSRHQPQQHGGGAFWYSSSSSPPPPAGYHPPPPPTHLAQNPPLPPHLPTYHHQPSYASQLPITPPPQHQLPQPWFHQQQQAPPNYPPPNYPAPYHGQPGLPPYPQPQHRYPPPPPPQPHPMAVPPAYPPTVQAWGNPSWQNHQLWEYPERNIHYSSEEDWAAKARAWATADSRTENHHARSQFTPLGRMDEHEYAYLDHLPKVVAPAVDNQLPLPPQSNGRALYNEHEAEARDTGHLISPPRIYYPSSSIYEQEVPYTYSSSQGNREAMDHMERSHESLHPQFTAAIQLSSVEEPHFIPGNRPAKPLSDTVDQPLDFQPKSTFGHDQHKQFGYSHVASAANEGVIDQNIVATSVHAWNSTTVPVASFPPIPLAPSGTQFDPSFASQASLPVHSTPVFGGIAAPSFQAPVSPISAPFVLGVGASLHSPDFPGDGNGSFSLSERPKKAAVPNWLREELIKKKSAITSTNLLHSGVVQMEDADMSFRKTDQADNQSLDSRRSTEEEDDDEDEVEAARSAAINQEIKRVLTEVLLKVTDELFDEIATKVLDEDEPTTDVVEITSFGNPKFSPPAIPIPKASSKILIPLRAESRNVNDANEKSSPSSVGGDLLGLANYGSDASDGDDDDNESQGAQPRKLDSASDNLETAVRSYEHALKDAETGKEALYGDANGDVQKEGRISLPESSERKKVGQFHANVPGVSETSEKTSSANSERAGEFRQDAKYLKSGGTAGSQEGGRRHESVHGDRTSSAECQDGEANILPSANRKPDKCLNNKGLINDVAAGSGSHKKDNENNKHGDKQKENIRKSDKLYERVGDRNIKQGAIERETHSKISSKTEIITDSKKEISKDKVEKKKDYERRSERKRDRKEDYKKDGKEDRSEFARETLRRNIRSKSPVRHVKDNSKSCRGSASSEESSDNSRKRKLQLRGASLSASPRSTKRQVSRSPHSKHSHSRHSPYSSARRNRRSRSISPVRRRRASKHE